MVVLCSMLGMTDVSTGSSSKILDKERCRCRCRCRCRVRGRVKVRVIVRVRLRVRVKGRGWVRSLETLARMPCPLVLM
jgi:hypothetical protein